MGPYGFHRRSLWLMTIEDDGRPVPHLSEFTDLEELPDQHFVDAFADLLGGLLMEAFDGRQVQLAFLLSRPGHDDPREGDLAWAAVLHDVARGLGKACEVVHLATDAGVLPLPLDAIGSARRSA